MAVSWKGDATLAVGQSGTFSPTMPTHAAGDMLIAIWMGKPFDSSVTVSGWIHLGSVTSGTTATGAADTGSMRIETWYKEAAGASETAPSFVEGATTWNVAAGGVAAWQKGGGETWAAPTLAGAGDEDLDISPSIAISDPSFAADDGVELIFACNSDSTTPFTAGPTISQSGATFGTVTKDRDVETAAGADGGYVTGHCLVTTAGTGNVTIAGTGTADPGSPRIAGAVIRLRLAVATFSPPFGRPGRNQHERLFDFDPWAVSAWQ